MTEVPEYFQVTIEHQGGIHLVTLEGELDLAVAPGLAEQIVSSTGSTVVLDLAGLTFMSAAGIAAIVDAKKRVTEKGHELIVRGASGIVRRVFEIVDLTSLLSDD